MVEGERASIAMMFACSRSTIASSANGRSETYQPPDAFTSAHSGYAGSRLAFDPLT